MGCFLGTGGKLKYMGKAIIKRIKIPLRFIGDKKHTCIFLSSHTPIINI